MLNPSPSQGPRRIRRTLLALAGLLPVGLWADAIDVAALAAVMDEGHPPGAALVASWRVGGESAFTQALVAHERQRWIPEWLLPAMPNTSEARARADDALANVFTLKGVRAAQAVNADGEILWDDWGPRGDKEWAWFLNRQAYFVDLAVTFRETGDPRYLRKIEADLESWVEAHPFPGRLNFSEAWRPLEVARRLQRSWIPTLFLLPRDHPVADAIRLRMLASVPDHARMLEEHPSFWGGNHLITEKLGLALCAALWPEFREAPRWRSVAATMVQRELLAQTYPDGAYRELSSHYHRIALSAFDTYARLAAFEAERGVAAPLPEGAQARLAAMRTYFMALAQPNGRAPLNNDGDLESVEHYFNLASDALWRSQDGTRWFPWAGQAVMRQGEWPNAQWAFFDLGPHGTAHQHEDRLHLGLSLGMREFLVDAGRYTYKPGPWRAYFTGGASHNVIRIDGRDALPGPDEVERPLPVLAAITPQAEVFGGGVLWSPGGERHDRTVLYRPGHYWLVLDEVRARPGARVEGLWHFHPDCALALQAGGARAESGERRLELTLVGPDRATLGVLRGSEWPLQGWYSPSYNQRLAAPTLTALAAAPARPLTWLWALQPDGVENRIWSIEADAAGGWILRGRTAAGREDRWTLGALPTRLSDWPQRAWSFQPPAEGGS